jgi:aryl-alcohol dehydrogenase-like predicted oxidoreductase
VSLVLSGASNPEQLRDGLAVSDMPGFTPVELQRVDDVHVRDFQAA